MEGSANRGKIAIYATITFYFAAVSGVAAWLGRQFFVWPVIATVVLVPAIVVVAFLFPSALRALGNRLYSVFLLSTVGAPILAAITFGGVGLITAWIIIEAVGDWRDRTFRTVIVVLGIVLVGIVITYAQRIKKPN